MQEIETRDSESSELASVMEKNRRVNMIFIKDI